MRKYLLGVLAAVVLLIPEAVRAHCPLCTIGAGAVAVGAAYYGVHTIVLGVFIGAFAIATGMWFTQVINKKFEKKFIPLQDHLIILSSFLTTIIPMMPIFKSDSSIYLSWIGEYGSLLNRTYLLNMFLVGAIIGSLIMVFTPKLSQYITKVRGKTFPYQTMLLILLVIVISGGILQLMM